MELGTSIGGCDKEYMNKDEFKYEVKETEEKEQYNSGAKRNSRKGKGRFDLISPYAEKRLAIRLEQGSDIYGDRNWEKGMKVSRFIDSAKRHINDYLSGENTEDHLAAAAFNIYAAMHMEDTMPEMMDIPSRLKDSHTI
jgi:hypothetical protein